MFNTEFPQLLVHTDGDAEVHVNPPSIDHPEDHPSPDIIFPSSQASPPLSTPFPHSCVQVEGDVGDPFTHVHPDSIPQPLLQPSPDDVFPSSHASVLILRPSPHTADHTVCPFSGTLQLNPTSNVQLGEQPSHITELPSSHASVAVLYS